jgi:hypothetical protein
MGIVNLFVPLENMKFTLNLFYFDTKVQFVNYKITLKRIGNYITWKHESMIIKKNDDICHQFNRFFFFSCDFLNNFLKV